MDLAELDPEDLRISMALALDFLVSHRVAHGGTYDRARVTAARDLLEQRVLRALEETDPTQMPEDWSWRQAAHLISIKAAMAIVEEEESSGRT